MLQLCAAILEGLINDFVIWTALSDILVVLDGQLKLVRGLVGLSSAMECLKVIRLQLKTLV